MARDPLDWFSAEIRVLRKRIAAIEQPAKPSPMIISLDALVPVYDNRVVPLKPPGVFFETFDLRIKNLLMQYKFDDDKDRATVSAVAIDSAEVLEAEDVPVNDNYVVPAAEEFETEDAEVFEIEDVPVKDIYSALTEMLQSLDVKMAKLITKDEMLQSLDAIIAKLITKDDLQILQRRFEEIDHWRKLFEEAIREMAPNVKDLEYAITEMRREELCPESLKIEVDEISDDVDELRHKIDELSRRFEERACNSGDSEDDLDYASDYEPTRPW